MLHKAQLSEGVLECTKARSRTRKRGAFCKQCKKKKLFCTAFPPSLTKDYEAGVKKTLDACMNAHDKQLGLWENGNLEMHVQVVA